MQIQDLSHPKTSKALNESVASKFGYKLNLEKFSLEQLKESRDKILDQIAKFETSKSYDAVYESAEYHKSRAFLDVITTAITERTLSPAEEKKAEKYVKGMKSAKGDFQKRYGKDAESVMYATANKMAKKESIEEAMDVLKQALAVKPIYENVLTEGEEEKAALIMSSRDMVDKLTSWLEDVASLKAEALLELVDSIRYELGSDISEQFSGIVKPALEELYTSLETNRQTLSQAVAILTGEQGPEVGMGAGPAPEAGIEADIAAGPDAMGMAPEAAAGGEEAAGRMKRESVERRSKKN